MFGWLFRKKTKKMNDADLLANELERAVCAENASFMCYSHLASAIKDGRIRNKLRFFSEKADKNRKFLTSNMKTINKEYSLPEAKCDFCNINCENFSIEGAINLGLELTNATARFYRGLLSLSSDSEKKKIIKKLLKEKIEEKKFLRKEKIFSHKIDETDDTANDVCIPNITEKFS